MEIKKWVRKLEVRYFKQTDEQDIVSLWEECNLLDSRVSDPIEDIAFCVNSGRGDILIMVSDDDIVGALMVGHDGHLGLVHYFGVSPGKRMQGVGRKLLGAAEHWWQEKGVKKAKLSVRETNNKVIGFYQRCGFAVEPSAVLSKRILSYNGEKIDLHLDKDVTITYLEMKFRPVSAVSDQNRDDFTVLKANSVTTSFYRYLYDAVGRSWRWTDRKILADNQLREILSDKNVWIYVLYFSGSPIGFFELDARQDETIDIAYFGLMPDFIGQGLGRWLLNQAIQKAWERKPDRLTVNTCTLDHPSALPLYKSFGFKTYKIKTVQGRF